MSGVRSAHRGTLVIGFIISLLIAGAVTIAFGLFIDLLPRWPNLVLPLTDLPFKDRPATNGAILGFLFLAITWLLLQGAGLSQ
jgi:hypothetical protein